MKTLKKNQKRGILLLIIGFFLISLGLLWLGLDDNEPEAFNGERALADVEKQLSFGFRSPGSDAHKNTITWMENELVINDWHVAFQNTEAMNHPITNVIATRPNSPKDAPWIMIGAHYDTRFYADQDPDTSLQKTPVAGANDGGSGVAILLELARVLPKNFNVNVWLVFFDAEDQGHILDWDWILGSKAFATSLTEYPDAVVIVDMIGDADLNIYKEHNSDTHLTDEIWQTAQILGYEAYFIPEYKYSILDDHLPFIEKGIPAADIIDMDYQYWHTTSDTLDKVSAQSLEIVGTTILTWLTQKSDSETIVH
jgi:Zn-dependent M28 family amino/carboxypeptidase